MDNSSLQQAEFENLLARQASADPVDLWSEYANWASKHRPQEHISVLARACKELTDDPRHHDDVRFLRLWVRFADSQGKVATHTFFGSLEEQGIGTKHALLYEAWAVSLETKRLFLQANAVYEKGIKRCARPLTRLRKNFIEFCERMARRKSREVHKRKRQATDENCKKRCSRENADEVVQLPLEPDQNLAPILPSAPVALEEQECYQEKNGSNCSNSNAEKSRSMGTYQHQHHSTLNRSRRSLVRSETRSMRSFAPYESHEQKPPRQSRRLSLRVPLRKSLRKLRDVHKRRRLSAVALARKSAASADIVCESNVSLVRTPETRPSLGETCRAGNDETHSVKVADGLLAIGEEMLVERNRKDVVCSTENKEIKEVDKTDNNTSWRLPWLPFRNRGC